MHLKHKILKTRCSEMGNSNLIELSSSPCLKKCRLYRQTLYSLSYENFILNLNDNSPDEEIQTSTEIQSSKQIDSGNVQYIAERRIKLLPGFKVSSGAGFIGEIIPSSDYIDYKHTNWAPECSYDIPPSPWPQENIMEKSLVITNKDTSNSVKQIFNVFPNPNKGSFEIQYFNNDTVSYNIEISNSLGQILYHKYDIYDQNFTTDITGFAKGLYIINLYSGSEFKSKKVIVD